MDATNENNTIPGNQAQPVSEDLKKKDVEENKDIAAFSYLWVMSVIVYLTRKNSPFIKFHSKQAIVLFIISIVLWFIPVVGNLLELFVLAGMVIGFLSAAQGQWKEVPVIGPLARGESSLRGAWKDFLGICIRLMHAVRGIFKSHRTKPTAAQPASPKAADSSVIHESSSIPESTDDL